MKQLKKTGQKLKEDPFTVSINPVLGEYETNSIEVIRRREKYTEVAPIHFSHFILSNAKLHMLRFIDMIIDYWQIDNVKLCYTGKLTHFLSFSIVIFKTLILFFWV